MPEGQGESRLSPSLPGSSQATHPPEPPPGLAGLPRPLAQGRPWAGGRRCRRPAQGRECQLSSLPHPARPGVAVGLQQESGAGSAPSGNSSTQRGQSPSPPGHTKDPGTAAQAGALTGEAPRSWGAWAFCSGWGAGGPPSRGIISTPGGRGRESARRDIPFSMNFNSVVSSPAAVPGALSVQSGPGDSPYEKNAATAGGRHCPGEVTEGVNVFLSLWLS